MLKVRVIPTLLWKDFGLVKGVRVRQLAPRRPRAAGHQGLQHARRRRARAPRHHRNRERHASPDLESVDDFADECFVPLTVGGGVASVDRRARCCVPAPTRSASTPRHSSDPGLVDELPTRFGSQCVVASIDARRGDGRHATSASATAGTRDDRPRPGRRGRASWSDRGAGEILLTSIERDGTMQGYDLELDRARRARLSTSR